MPTTYTNGLKLPDLGSIDWYNSYKNNIDILDPIVGTVNGVATTYAPISHNHSASEITSGTIDIARLPPAALERMHIVADQTARYALTTSTVQEGDTVKQTDTGVMYLVVDSTKLNNADGYTEYSAGTASKAIADEDGTSIKTGYVNVAGNQTVSGDKSFTGSNTFNNILPNATNTYSLGSSSYQWSSVYAQSYYYNGTAWGLDKDNTWTGNNEYKSVLGLTGGEIWFKDPAIEDITSNPSSDISKSIFQFYNKTQTQYTGGIIERYLTDGTHQINISCLGFQLNNYGVYYAHSFYFEAKRDGTGSFFPSLNNVNLGISTNQWKSVYAQTYYYNGTQWGLDQPNTWSNINSFQREITLAGDRNAYVAPMWTGVGSGLSLLTQDASKSLFIGNYTNDANNRKVLDTSKSYLRIITGESNGENISYIEPINSSDSGLGTSTNKWKTLNGINPGALSLPINANSASFNIDTTNWTTDGSIIIYTPLLDGWIYINARNDDTNGDSFIIFDDGVSSFGTSVFGNKGLQNSGVGLLCLMMPVNKNNSINIRIKSPGIISARLYPCLGNV